jgi:Na+(H+)/acetate symporter ActP
VGWSLRTLLYFLAGGLVGFLLLGEFALATFVPVLAGLLILAVVSLVGGMKRQTALSAWSVFLLAAMVVPLMIEVRVVGLPRCAEVPAGVACMGGDRDYQSPFWFDFAIFAVAALGSALHLGTATPTRQTPRP